MENKKIKNKESENIMRKIRIDKIVLNVGGTADTLDKGYRLLKFLTGKKPAKIKSKKRIPTWGVRPGLEVGAVVTLRKDYMDFLKKMLISFDNVLKKKQMSENNYIWLYWSKGYSLRYF